MNQPPFRFMPPLGPRRATPRERVLSQWRGINLEPLEKGRTLRAKSPGGLLPQVLKSIRIERRRAEAEVATVWNSLLNPVVTAHAKPTGLRNGTLFVSVDSNAWLSEIVGYHREEILERLQHSFGRELIARISFRVG